MDAASEAAFVFWAYFGVAVIVLALIGYAIFDGRRVRHRLKALEARGIRRRSAGPSGPAA